MTPETFGLIKLLRYDAYTTYDKICNELEIDRKRTKDLLKYLSNLQYEIEEHPSLGVRIISSPDLLLPEFVCSGLHTRLFGKKIHYYKKIGSTNDVALKLSDEEGSLVITEFQSKGRGRFGRKWVSTESTAILASLILNHKLKVEGLQKITLLCALSINEVMRKVGLSSLIKWPNDIVVGGRKICGILTEANSRCVVCGFGVNVNQSEFPSELTDEATSIRIETQREHSRIIILQQILEQFENNYFEFLQSGFHHFLEKIKDYSFSLGKRVSVHTGKKVLKGEVLDFDERGRLVLRKDGGGIRKIFATSMVSIQNQSIAQHSDRKGGN